MATFSAMFGARPSSVNIAGRRDVAGASSQDSKNAAMRGNLQSKLGQLSPARTPGKSLRTPKPLRPQSVQMADKENVDPQHRPLSLQIMAGSNLEGKDGHRKRIVISPSQWFNKGKCTPKTTRCTIRDSPSHAGAIAALRDNKKVHFRNHQETDKK